MRTVAFFTVLGLGVLGAGDWRTYSGDAQRTGWAKAEKTLSKQNVGNLKVEWTAQLDNEPIEMWNLTAPVVIPYNYTPQGVRDIAVVAGSSDTIYGIDIENGKILWKKKFSHEGTPVNKGTGGWLCPNAIVATPYIDGETKTVYVISSDGKLHSLAPTNGEDRVAPIQFVPPFSKNWSLNMVDGVLYTTVSQGCNGARNGVYAMDLKDAAHPVTSYRTYGGVWGRAGAAAGFDGRIYAEIGDGPFDPEAGKLSDAFIALEPKTLKLADWYAPKNQVFIDKKDLDMGNMSPVVFRFKGRELIAGSGKEGVIYLLDSKSLGGDDHRSPLYRSPGFTNEEANFQARGFWGALSVWEDGDGTTWLYGPAYGPQHPASPVFPTAHGEAPDGSIMAFKVVDKNGKPELSPAWRSVNMIAPDPAVIANGIVYALATGDATRQVASGGGILSSKERLAETKPAVLHAFDAQTGKQLFSSGSTLKSFAHFSGLAVAEGRVFATTFDGKLHCFGLGDRGQ